MPLLNQSQSLASDSPYSLENFQWLMENSSVKDYLSENELREVEAALNDGDEVILQRHYDLLLEQFLIERDRNIDLGLQEESLMQEFSSSVSDISHEVQVNQKARNDDVEAQEHAGADDILNELE